MPSVDTVDTIFNAALDIVGERPLASLTENRAEVRWLLRNYSRYVQASLRQDVWNFACEFWTLNQDITKPAFRWLYQYSLPNGWLRVLPITLSGIRNGTPVPHEVKNNKVFSDQSTPFFVELIMDRQVPGTWDPLFANLVAARLAHGLAHTLTKKASYVQLAKQAIDEAYQIAQMANAFEGTPPATEQHDVIRVRSL